MKYIDMHEEGVFIECKKCGCYYNMLKLHECKE